MKIAYDTEVDVLTIVLKDGDCAESNQISPYVIVDFDDQGVPLAIEILNAQRFLQTDGTLKLELPLQISTG